MEGTIVVVILVILLLIGIVSYYVYDYYKYKVKVDTDFTNTNKRVDTEKSERLGNVKSVVDQVNDVHGDIHNDFTSLKKNVNGINNGLKTAMRFNDRGLGGKSKSIGLQDLPGAVTPSIDLLTHVTTVGGLTIKNLEAGTNDLKKFKICGKQDPTKCIEIPDKDGNIYLTNLYKDSAISLDGSTVINAPLSFTQAGKLGARISANDDGTGFMETSGLGIGSMKAKPTASLHIMSDQTINKVSPFKVTINSNDVLDIDQNGTVHTTRIELRPAGTTNTTAILQAVNDGIMLDAQNVYTSGNLLVKGMIYQSATSVDQTDKLVATVASTTAPTTTVPTTTVPTTTTSTTTIPTTTTPTTTTSTTTEPTITSPTTTSPTTTPSIATFVDGPILMASGSSFYTPKPIDYMNQPYMIKTY